MIARTPLPLALAASLLCLAGCAEGPAPGPATGTSDCDVICRMLQWLDGSPVAPPPSPRGALLTVPVPPRRPWRTASLAHAAPPVRPVAGVSAPLPDSPEEEYQVVPAAVPARPVPVVVEPRGLGPMPGALAITPPWFQPWRADGD